MTVERAVVAARAVQPAWAEAPVATRLAPVRGLRRTLAEHGSELAGLAAAAPGAASRAEALSAQIVPLADACRFLEREARALLAPRRQGRRGRPGWLAGVDLTVHREPHGIALIIAPANYRALLPGVQALQALVAGNAVLVKPGPGGGDAARWLAGSLAEAGLPAGLFTVLSEHPGAARQAIAAGVDHVVLTGSADTGRILLAELAPRLVPATLELSGSDPLIALPDADPERVAAALAFALRLHGGATCIAPRRAYLAGEIAATVEAALLRRLEASPAEAGASGGDRQAMTRAREAARQAVDAGARLVAGSLAVDAPPAPLVVAGPRADAPLLEDDVFAPFVALVAVGSVDEAVARANASPYALGASVFGDERRARRVAARLAAGSVTIQDVVVPTADPRAPFGGRGRSGFGVTRGAEGLLAATVPKTVAVRRSPARHLDPPHPADEGLFAGWLALAHGSGLRVRAAGAVRLARALRDRRASATPLCESPPSLVHGAWKASQGG